MSVDRPTFITIAEAQKLISDIWTDLTTKFPALEDDVQAILDKDINDPLQSNSCIVDLIKLLVTELSKHDEIEESGSAFGEFTFDSVDEFTMTAKALASQIKAHGIALDSIQFTPSDSSFCQIVISLPNYEQLFSSAGIRVETANSEVAQTFFTPKVVSELIQQLSGGRIDNSTSRIIEIGNARLACTYSLAKPSETGLVAKYSASENKVIIPRQVAKISVRLLSDANPSEVEITLIPETLSVEQEYGFSDLGAINGNQTFSANISDYNASIRKGSNGLLIQTVIDGNYSYGLPYGTKFSVELPVTIGEAHVSKLVDGYSRTTWEIVREIKAGPVTKTITIGRRIGLEAKPEFVGDLSVLESQLDEEQIQDLLSEENLLKFTQLEFKNNYPEKIESVRLVVDSTNRILHEGEEVLSEDEMNLRSTNKLILTQTIKIKMNLVRPDGTTAEISDKIELLEDDCLTTETDFQAKKTVLVQTIIKKLRDRIESLFSGFSSDKYNDLVEEYLAKIQETLEHLATKMETLNNQIQTIVMNGPTNTVDLSDYQATTAPETIALPEVGIVTPKGLESEEDFDVALKFVREDLLSKGTFKRIPDITDPKFVEVLKRELKLASAFNSNEQILQAIDKLPTTSLTLFWEMLRNYEITEENMNSARQAVLVIYKLHELAETKPVPENLSIRIENIVSLIVRG